MRLRDIWTSGYPLTEKWSRTSEWFWASAGRLVPQRLAYWSFIHQGVKNIRDDEVVPEVPYMVVLERVSKS